MKKLTEIIVEAGLHDRIFNDRQLARLIAGSAQRRYALVNRAIKSGELIRYQRGLYSLASSTLKQISIHPFYLAQNLSPGSYISLETALAYHGWIPEAVYTTASIVPGRKSRIYDHATIGRFSFHPLALQNGYFLELVERVMVNKHAVLIAQPIRALMDLVCFKKVEWQGLDWLIQSLRIEVELLETITQAQLKTLHKVYSQKRAVHFLEALSVELGVKIDD